MAKRPPEIPYARGLSLIPYPYQLPFPKQYHFFSSNKNDTKKDTITVSIDEVKSRTALALHKIGRDEGNAALQAKIMTAAEVCDNNQGINKDLSTRHHGTHSQFPKTQCRTGDR